MSAISKEKIKIRVLNKDSRHLDRMTRRSVHSVKTCGLKDVVIFLTGIKIVGMNQNLKLTLDAVLEYTRSMFG
jgi:hypothetical protein